MGKTITTHLVDGKIEGIQRIQSNDFNMGASVIPQAKFKNISKDDIHDEDTLDEVTRELKKPCLYILIGEGEQKNAIQVKVAHKEGNRLKVDKIYETKIYIGQSEDFLERIRGHMNDDKKTFVQKAIIFTSESNSLNTTYTKYLECLAIKEADKCGNCSIENKNKNPKDPTLKKHEVSDVKKFFEQIKFITEFIGISIFRSNTTKEKTKQKEKQPLNTSNIPNRTTKEQIKQKEEQHEIFFCKRKDTIARGYYDGNGFTVLAGSTIQKEVTPSFEKRASKKRKEKREKILKEFVELENGKYRLTEDYRFNSPNEAYSICTGGIANSKEEWKKTGKTLKEM